MSKANPLVLAICTMGCWGSEPGDPEGSDPLDIEQRFDAEAGPLWEAHGPGVWETDGVRYEAECGAVGWFTRDAAEAEDVVVESEVVFLDTDVGCSFGIGVMARVDETSAIACTLGALGGPPAGDEEDPLPPDYYEAEIDLFRIDLATGETTTLASDGNAANMGDSTVRLEAIGPSLTCTAVGAETLQVTGEDADPRTGSIGLVSDGRTYGTFRSFAASEPAAD